MSRTTQGAKIKRTLLPGKPGTQKYSAQHGDRLVCVRYRYDRERQRKITTVEIIVDEHPWIPDEQRIPPNKILSLKVKYGEIAVGRAIKMAGGKWDKEQQVWRLAYQQVKALGMLDRVISSDRPAREVQTE